ncbi:hypothetical protein D3272_08135 [Lichenibacterium ramalinae]|uniref:Uncharacterized protein n=2 Tax=Lichenibacterium ramalinae TaxID=2316527 RepID=A0A4V1RIY0_9HYPH|nr:hypothetical protein D3272_08135 [Lichenibacterium ramalinae]
MRATDAVAKPSAFASVAECETAADDRRAGSGDRDIAVPNTMSRSSSDRPGRILPARAAFRSRDEPGSIDMADYILAVGTQDPHGFAAPDEAEAVRYAVGFLEQVHAETLRDRPQDVVTLMGASGLVTRPSERIDEFVQRLPGDHPGIDPDRFQPGDANTPDCNGD